MRAIKLYNGLKIEDVVNFIEKEMLMQYIQINIPGVHNYISQKSETPNSSFNFKLTISKITSCGFEIQLSPTQPFM